MSALLLMSLIGLTMFIPIFDGDSTIEEEDDMAPLTPPEGMGDLLDGTDGPDDLTASDNDTVNAGAGDDLLAVEAGTSGAVLNGDAGNDTLTDGGATDVVLNGGEGADSLNLTVVGNSANGDEGQDTITLIGGTTANGGEGDDTLTATGGADGSIANLFGGRGDDVLIEGASDSGGTLNFQADGGLGNDTIQAQLELSGEVDETLDTLTGGARGDTFMLDLNSDEADAGLLTGVQITDFDPTEDRLIIETTNIDGQETTPPSRTFGDFMLSEAADGSYTDVLLNFTQLLDGNEATATVRLFGVTGIAPDNITLVT